MIIGILEPGGYFVAPDKGCPEYGTDVYVPRDRVLDNRPLNYLDRVEFETEETPKGLRATWCKWIGHGRKASQNPEPQLIEGSGYILRDAERGLGSIKPDVNGADNVKFHRSAVQYKGHSRGDRVTFVARLNHNGRWIATEVRQQVETWGDPAARDWRDSWK